MVFKLNFSTQAFKELEKINEPFYSIIKQAIFYLTDNPRPHGYLKLKGRNDYRIRIGSYHVI
jgi:mRNA interferase RelE/StbE